MEKQLGSFDPQQYISQKALTIVSENEEIKLSAETLKKLTRIGRNLVPPIRASQQ